MLMHLEMEIKASAIAHLVSNSPNYRTIIEMWKHIRLTAKKWHVVDVTQVTLV